MGPAWREQLQELHQAGSWDDPGGGHALSNGALSPRILASRQTQGWVTGSSNSPDTAEWAQEFSQLQKRTKLPHGSI